MGQNKKTEERERESVCLKNRFLFKFWPLDEYLHVGLKGSSKY